MTKKNEKLSESMMGNQNAVGNDGGRPSKYDPKYCEMIVEHMKDGASMTSFAAEIDVARTTLNEWGYNHPEFSEAIKRAKAKCAAWWESLARQGAMGEDVNPTLIIFGLKNMSPEEWKDKQEINHESSGGTMSPQKASLTDEQIKVITTGLKEKI